MAIDEYRRDFVRVPWGGSGTVSYDKIEGLQRFDQVWFAGNHSDIGGSYPENESRLSDISLQWMAEIVNTKLPEEARVHVQSNLLQCFPSSDGMMHDELMAGVGSHHLHLFVRGDRLVDPGGTLHPTVIDRLKMKTVRNFVGFGPYQPKSLTEHPQAKEYYVDHQSRGDETPQSDSVSK
jgi:type VI secretion system (T6SS) phospholipase Tle1-like effector